MTYIKTFALALIAAFSLAASPLMADIILENWQFDDASGTQLNSVLNTGTQGTSWNFGGPRTQIFSPGTLNIGDTGAFRWDPNNSSNTNNRSASFSAVTSGQHVFEYRISSWNFNTEAATSKDNIGLRFNIGEESTTNQAYVRLDYAPFGTSAMRVASDGQNGVDGTFGNYGVGFNSSFNSTALTMQINMDLDTGAWTSRVKKDSEGTWNDLVIDGSGLTTLDRIQMSIVTNDSSNPGAWEYNSDGSGDFVKLDYVTLTQLSAVPEPTSFTLFGLVSMGLMAQRRRRG